MLIKTWEFISVIDSDYPDENEVALIKEEYCTDYEEIYDEATRTYEYVEFQIENCSPPTSVSLTFSTYGTYTVMTAGSSDGTIVEEMDTWEWIDDSQTQISIGDDGYDDFTPIVIETLTDDSLIMSMSFEAYIDPEYPEYSEPAYTVTYILSSQ